jgi:carboxypeptidase Taq
LSSVVDLLGWDEQVNLPEGSADFRSEQMAFMSELVHRESTSSEYLKILMAAEDEILSNRLSPEFRLVVEEARKEFNRETRLPS